MAVSITYYQGCLVGGYIYPTVTSDVPGGETLNCTLQGITDPSFIQTKTSPTSTTSYEFLFYNLPDGEYQIKANGSISPSIDGPIRTVACDTRPCDLVINSIAIKNDVNSQSIGAITVNASSSYFRNYSLNGGAYQPGNTFQNLPSGTYTISVTDANNCEQSGTVVVENQACSISITKFLKTHETTPNANDGSISVTASSISGGIQYRIDGGAFQSSGNFTNIAPGVHTLWVLDQAQCYLTQNFTINEYVINPPVACFEPDMLISKYLPYRFITQRCNVLDQEEELYSDESFCGEKPCYFQPLNCSDTLTLMLYYSDPQYYSVPVLKIREYGTNALVGTVPFTPMTEDYYKLEKNVNEISNICGKRVYLEIKSKSSESSSEYYVHAVSEPIYVSNHHNCNLLLEYWNNSNYGEILYEGTGYINKLRLEASLNIEDYPQEMDVYVKSNGERVKLREDIIEQWLLETDYLPPYVHKIIALALSHDNVRIGNVLLIKEEPYSFDRVPNYALSRGSAKLITKYYQSKNLIK